MVRALLLMLLGLMMAVLLPDVAKAEAWPKCLDEGYLSSFDPRMTPRPCEVVTTARINWAGGHRTLRVIRPTGLPVGNDADLIRRIDETAALIGPAMDKMGGLTVDDIDLFEINEAFASVVLKFQKDLNIPDEKLNVNGGAIAMGHPLGATGAMITGTMVDELERRGAKRALVTLCIGGGMGVATIIERV